MAITPKGKATPETPKTKGRGTPMQESASREATAMNAGIKKEYLKARKVCRVTFRLPKIAASDAKSVCVVGDFNGWSIHANPMKKLRTGDYTTTLELEPGREYQFRYFVDESRWENDWNADKYVKSPYGDSDNSVVVV
jgi:1,4-alpha-glucan branching enzyme